MAFGHLVAICCGCNRGYLEMIDNLKELKELNRRLARFARKSWNDAFQSSQFQRAVVSRIHVAASRSFAERSMHGNAKILLASSRRRASSAGRSARTSLRPVRLGLGVSLSSLPPLLVSLLRRIAAEQHRRISSPLSRRVASAYLIRLMRFLRCS